MDTREYPIGTRFFPKLDGSKPIFHSRPDGFLETSYELDRTKGEMATHRELDSAEYRADQEPLAAVSDWSN